MASDTANERQATRATSILGGESRLGPWRAFLTAHFRLVDRLDHDLRAEAGMSLADYSALLQLAEAPGRRLRMSDLAMGIFLSRSGVTRLIDRLQADGLVARNQCLSDGRGAEAVLTDKGLATLRTASGTHLRGIQRYFLDQVSDDQLEVIGNVMGAIADGLDTDDASSQR